MKLVALIACLTFVNAQDFDLRVVEHGLLLDEHVRLPSEDLVMLEVPQHHDLQHTTVALDFRGNQSMTLYHSQGYCQLSALPASIPRPAQMRQGLKSSKSYVHFAGLAKNQFLLQLQTNDALSDLSNIREELRQLCVGKPVYKSRALQLQKDLKEGEEVLVADPVGHSALRVRRQNEFFCPIEKFNQKCLTKNAAKSCYYTVLCQDIEVGQPNPQCVQHLRNINVQCVPCCDDPRTPDDGFIRACSRTNIVNVANCRREQESKCFKQSKTCIRSFIHECDGQRFGSVEACGDWECN